jgi:methylated-DNA-protein-cysteine methyltransferase-like protein
MIVRVEVCEKVYAQVRKIPKGKVTTYKQITLATGINPRVVGNALHLNPHPDVPCHRVVNVMGRIAPSFGLGGPAEQRERLEEEGVLFKRDLYVDLKKYLWIFPN